MSDITEKVEIFFKKDYDEVEDNGENSYRLIQSAKPCLDFNVNEQDNYIYIDYLQNCGSKSGRKNLENIENFAKSENIGTIKLADDSHLNLCKRKIDLSLLKILANGKSWYNSMGYLSSQNNIEIKQNLKLITEPFLEFLAKLQNFISNETNKLSTKSSMQSTRNKLNLLVKANEIINLDFLKVNNRDITVTEYFKKVLDQLASESDYCKEEYEWLYVLLEVIKMSKLVTYNNILSKQLNNVSGGKTRKKRRYTRTKKVKRKRLRNIKRKSKRRLSLFFS